MKISEIMTRRVHVVPGSMALCQAAGIMRDTDVGFLVVGEGLRYDGTITDRDMVVRALAARAKPDTVTVADVMETSLVTCLETDSVETVAELMGHHKVRRIPVMDRKGLLVGVVSLGDLATRTGQIMVVGRAEGELARPVAGANALRA